MNKTEMTFLGIAILCVFVTAVFFYSEFKLVSNNLIQTYGLIAVFFLVIIMDSFIQPISPDIFVLGATLSGHNLIAASLVGGIASCIGGIIGYQIGKQIGKRKFKKWFGKDHLEKGKTIINKHGIWAIIVGAFSPIPYSSVCWVAGIYKMKFPVFVITSILTRIPRFFFMGYIGFLI
ncbi:DedA family protein [Candidatus Woesearchaeota archaeon]|jgi:membrane protein YqaA with SNARE-associated domain|nr:DedA family protein [Candidatus Woesearchaeota archaeon]